jgi:hypothetical protein
MEVEARCCDDELLLRMVLAGSIEEYVRAADAARREGGEGGE